MSTANSIEDKDSDHSRLEDEKKDECTRFSENRNSPTMDEVKSDNPVRQSSCQENQEKDTTKISELPMNTQKESPTHLAVSKKKNLEQPTEQLNSDTDFEKMKTLSGKTSISNTHEVKQNCQSLDSKTSSKDNLQPKIIQSSSTSFLPDGNTLTSSLTENITLHNCEKDHYGNTISVSEQYNTVESNKKAEHGTSPPLEHDSSKQGKLEPLAPKETSVSANEETSPKTTAVSTSDKPKLSLPLSTLNEFESDAESDDDLALHIDESPIICKDASDSVKDASFSTSFSAELKNTESNDTSITGTVTGNTTSPSECVTEKPFQESGYNEEKTNMFQDEMTSIVKVDETQDKTVEVTKLNLNGDALNLNTLKIKLQKFKELNRMWQNRKPNSDEKLNPTADRTNLFDSFSANVPSGSTEQCSLQNNDLPESKDDHSTSNSNVINIKTSELSAKESSELSAKESSEESTKETSEKSTKETCEQSAKEISEQSIKEISEQSTKEISEHSTKEISQLSAKEISQLSAKETCEQSANEISQQLAKEISQHWTKEISEAENIVKDLDNESISMEDHNEALQEELKSLNMILGGEAIKERQSSKENPQRDANCPEQIRLASVPDKVPAEKEKESDPVEPVLQETDQQDCVHSQQIPQTRLRNNSCSIETEAAILQERGQVSEQKDVDLQENEQTRTISDKTKVSFSKGETQPTVTMSSGGKTVSELKVKEKSSSYASQSEKTPSVMEEISGIPHTHQERNLQQQQNMLGEKSSQEQTSASDTNYDQMSQKSQIQNSSQKSTGSENDPKQVTENFDNINEDNLTEDEMNLKLCEIFNLQENPKEVNSDKESTSKVYNESLTEVLNLDSDYTPAIRPKPVPLQASDVDWPVLGAKRCSRCGFTTSDDALLQVHTCRRPSLTGESNSSNAPLFKRAGLLLASKKTKTPASSVMFTSPVAQPSSGKNTSTDSVKRIEMPSMLPKSFHNIRAKITFLGNNKFFCCVCNFSADGSLFIGHLIEHMLQYPYSCPYCRNSGMLLFQHSSEIKAHIETHRDLSDRFSMFGCTQAKAFMDKVIKAGYDYLPSIWMKGASPVVQSVPVILQSDASINHSSIPQQPQILPANSLLLLVPSAVQPQIASSGSQVASSVKQSGTFLPVLSTTGQSVAYLNTLSKAVQSKDSTMLTVVQSTSSAYAMSTGVKSMTTTKNMSAAVESTASSNNKSAVDSPSASVDNMSPAIQSTASVADPPIASGNTAAVAVTSTNMYAVVSSTPTQTNSKQFTSSRPLEVDNHVEHTLTTDKTADGKIKVVVGKIDNMMVCKNCHFNSASAELFRKHIWNHLHERNTPCQHKKNVPPSLTFCPHVKNIMGTVHPESPEKASLQKSSVVEKSLQNTTPNNEERKESLPLDDDDDDCQIIEEDKPPPICVDLTEDDDEPESSHTESTTKIQQATTNIPATDLKISAAFSLSNENQFKGYDPACEPSGVPVPLNSSSERKQPVEADKRSSMFYVCGFGDCQFCCKTSDQFKNHVLANHRGAQLFPCAHCAYQSPGEEELFRHMNTHTSAKMFLLYKCAFQRCRFGTNLISEFQQHNEIVHKDANCYGCVSCKTEYSVLSQLIVHFQGVLLKFVQCPYCTVKAKDKRTIITHISEMHPDKPRQITVTSQLACQHQSKEARRASETRSLTPSVENQCSVDSNNMNAPSMTDDNPEVTKEHVEQNDLENAQKYDGSGDLKCKVCPFVTKCLSEFNKHFKEHEVVQIQTESCSPDSTTGNNQRKFSCPGCKKGFDRYKYLEKHVSLFHKEIKKLTLFRCKLCTFVSTSVGKTQKHSGLRHPGKPIIFRLNRKIGIKSKPVDTENKDASVDQFHCNQCDFSSKEHSEYLVHCLSHNSLENNEGNGQPEVASTTPTKNNPEDSQLPQGNLCSTVKCPECQYTTSVRLNLLRHMKYHKSWDQTEYKMTSLAPKINEGESSPAKSSSQLNLPTAERSDGKKTTSPGKNMVNPVGTSPKREHFYSCKLCSFRAPSVQKVNLHLAHCKNKFKTCRRCNYCDYKCNSNTTLYMHHRKEHMELPFKSEEISKKDSTKFCKATTPQKRKASQDPESDSKKTKNDSPNLKDNDAGSSQVNVVKNLLCTNNSNKEDDSRKNFDQSPCKSNTAQQSPRMEINKKQSLEGSPKVNKMLHNRDQGTDEKASGVVGKQSFKCGKCSTITASKVSFSSHFKTRHGFKEEPIMISVVVYQCLDCGRRFRSKQDADAHNLRCFKRVLRDSVQSAAAECLNGVEDPEDVGSEKSSSVGTVSPSTPKLPVSPKSQCTKPNKLTCKFCHYSNFNSSHMREHYYTHFSGFPYNCSYCDYGNKRGSNVILHLQTKHPDEEEVLKRNEKMHKEINKLLAENALSSKSRIQVSSLLGNTEISGEIKQEKSTPVKPLTIQHDAAKQYHCKFCDYTSSIKKTVKKHERRRHNSERLKCTVCDFQGLYPYNIRNHFCKHHPEIKVNYVKVGHTEESFSKDVPRLANDAPFDDHEFVVIADEDTESKLNAHFPLSGIYVRFRDPTNRESFKCEACDFTCHSSSLIASHVYTHMPQCFQCIHCDYKCYPSSAITGHIKIHHAGPVKCKYYMNAGLREYNKLLASLGKPPHKPATPKKRDLSPIPSPGDEVTGKGVKRRARHLMFDSESDCESDVKRPTIFCCHLCNFKIKDIDKYGEHLTLHESFMNHSELKKFACGFCSFSSQDPKDFNDHVATHVTERPFKCSYCGYSCFSKKNMLRHLECKHPVEEISYLRTAESPQTSSSSGAGINLNPSVVIVDSFLALSPEEWESLAKTSGISSMQIKALSNDKLVKVMKNCDLTDNGLSQT